MGTITCPSCGKKYDAMVLLGPHDELPPAPPPDPTPGPSGGNPDGGAVFSPSIPNEAPEISPQLLDRWGDLARSTDGLGEAVLKRVAAKSLTDDEFKALRMACNGYERERRKWIKGTLEARLREHSFSDSWYAHVLTRLVYK